MVCEEVIYVEVVRLKWGWENIQIRKNTLLSDLKKSQICPIWVFSSVDFLLLFFLLLSSFQPLSLLYFSLLLSFILLYSLLYSNVNIFGVIPEKLISGVPFSLWGYIIILLVVLYSVVLGSSPGLSDLGLLSPKFEPLKMYSAWNNFWAQVLNRVQVKLKKKIITITGTLVCIIVYRKFHVFMSSFIILHVYVFIN